MIRNAGARDASRLAEILIFAKRAAYRPIFQNDIVSFNEMQVLDLALSFQNLPETLKDVYVFDDGIVKGMMRWDRSMDGERQWHLCELYVDPFFWSQGIGASLMTEFLSQAKTRGVERVTLWVLEKNARAVAFYEKFGFRWEGATDTEPGTEEIKRMFVKDLSKPCT